jgi:hypothetical protein
MIILVSSEKKCLELLFMMTGKSSTYNRNNKGPKIDSWGIPLLTLPQLE